MNENELNNFSSDNGQTSNENLSRSEKILAIKRAMSQSSGSDMNKPDNNYAHSDTINFGKPPAEQESVNASVDEWENEIAQRIARRVQEVKNKQQKNISVDSLLEQLENPDSKKKSSFGRLNSESSDNNGFYAQKASESAAKVREFASNHDASPSPDSYENAQNYEAETDSLPPVNVPEKPVEISKKKKKKKKKKLSVKECLMSLIPHKGDSVPEIIRKSVFLIAIVAFIICSYIILDYVFDNAHTQKVYEEVMENYNPVVQEEPPAEDTEYWPLLAGAKNLLDINKDVVGVIEIPGTDVFYPVLQADNNEKYLDKNIKGEDAKAGAIFMDYRNNFDRTDNGHPTEPNSQNLIIYGHNMENGMMFGTLKQYRNNVHYYGEHPVIKLNSNYHCFTYKIFAFFIVDAEDTTDTYFDYWNKLNFNDEQDFYYFVNEAKRRSIRLNSVDVRYGDELLTLSTCNGIFGEDAGGRLVVLARKLRDGEDELEGTQDSVANPNIKWPSIYYKYNKKEKYDPDAEFVPYG